MNHKRKKEKIKLYQNQAFAFWKTALRKENTDHRKKIFAKHKSAEELIFKTYTEISVIGWTTK